MNEATKVVEMLERCIDGSDCDSCDYVDNCACKEYLLQDAIDTINCQKAEIERLQKENEQFADIGKLYSEIKVETIKKFKHKIRTLFRLNFLRRKCYDEIFDEAEAMMLKEMAGDEQ